MAKLLICLVKAAIINIFLTFNSGSNDYVHVKHVSCSDEPAENDHEIPLKEHLLSFSLIGLDFYGAYRFGSLALSRRRRFHLKQLFSPVLI